MRALPWLLLISALSACGDPEPAPPPTDLEDLPPPPIHTPRWAFTPWISKDISTGQDTRDFVQGFRDRDIPVGVVVLDSPWETNYNTFVPNPTRYPEFGKMVADLKADDIRTVLWTTQLINDDSFDLEPGGDTYNGASPNYREALDRGYFVNGGERHIWWKGVGGAIDFYNPEAIRWWHRQQDPLLDLGVAGWKLDFGDSYVMTDPVQTAAGAVPHQDYSEAYYRDFWSYGVHRQGAEDFLTMVRPWDESYGFPGRFFARKEHCPVGWVGDNRRDFVGLEDALDHLFRSAEVGYVVIGSDLGGYLDRDDRDLTGPVLPFDVEVFARWTGVAALTPFMQLHGRANITPWTVPERVDETVAMYRYWATLHQALIPFFYSLAEEAYQHDGPPIMRPIGTLASWAGDYRFHVGEAFLVAPLLDHRGFREVALPSGARYYDWWDPTQVHEGGTTVTASMSGDLARIPLYLREGAIVPAEVERGLIGLGETPGLTVLLAPGRSPAQFMFHEEDQVVTVIDSERGTDGAGTLRFSRLARSTLLKILGTVPGSVAQDGRALPKVADLAVLGAEGWTVAAGATWVRLSASPAATQVDLRP